MAWPDLDLDRVDEATVDKLLTSTGEAIKQQVEGGRAIFIIYSSVLTQASTLAVASFGAAAVSSGATSSLHGWAVQLWATLGLFAACVFWIAAAGMAGYGMRAAEFGSISPDQKGLADPDIFYASHLEAKVWLLRVQMGAMSDCRQNTAKNRIWLDRAIAALVTAPAAGFLAAGVCKIILLTL